MEKTFLIIIRGLVQGVGFRPFIYRIATSMKLLGNVENRNDGVFVKIHCNEEILNDFITRIKESSPPASRIESINVEVIDNEFFDTFSIKKSENVSEEVTEISPDIAVCNDCLNDMKNQEHRIDYPFINCTNCGPRFSIIQDLPYDREKTTMSDFSMCEKCYTEYTDVLDRRFHAQPVACNKCGPVYELHWNGETISEFDTILNHTAKLLDTGKVIAMKGLGGFHLSCNALDDKAVKRLRNLKNREGKPLAVMFRNIEAAEKFVFIDNHERAVLTSWRKPIVVLKEKTGNPVPESVSNGLDTIGIMLPYMPFHFLLFEKLKTDAIILTSGNISDEPIVIKNENARKKLLPISDALLTYNRDIYNRTDDSVIFIANRKENIIRRSRGYVPNPVNLTLDAEGIFAAGAELKNSFCIGKGKQAVLSQHIGDLKNIETLEFYKETVSQFRKLYRANPSIAVGDMHPDYLSTRVVNEMDVPKFFVQHHHAHIASCMAEHGLDEEVIGVSFDGTGFGDDGNSWGGEFFICDLEQYRRINHFEYIPMPGGDRVSDEPWRMAVSYLYKVYGSSFLDMKLPFLKNIPAEKIKLLLQAIDKKLNCPLTSSAGRLFDAIASLTGLCHINSFEAEAPMRLESVIGAGVKEKYLYDINEVVQFDQTIKGIISDVLNSISPSIISAKFHNTIISVILDMARVARNISGLNKVVLSGGVFQNRYLIENTEKLLMENKFEVYGHSLVPANDGGIALGQLAIAAKRRQVDKLT